jgi:hypothetical protein
MGHYLRECPNLPTLATKENVGSFTLRFLAEEKGKTQVHLIELTKGFDGFGEELQNP